MNDQWYERSRPHRLERRYNFADYHSLRDFLDRAAELSEQQGLYPDMGFGRDYVNITIHAVPESKQLDATHHRFAEQLDRLLAIESSN